MSDNYNVNITDDDVEIYINARTKAFETDILKNTKLIKGDHQSERLTFIMDRYVEYKDMFDCDKIEVHYINISPSSKESVSGVYTVNDITQLDSDKIRFSWLISRNATLYAGSVNFIIKFINLDDDNNVVYSWSTVINKELTVGESIDCDGVVDEEYIDILAQWEESIRDDFSDFVITGTLLNEDNYHEIAVSDVSCTYEEARAAFDAGKNVKCILASPQTGVYVTANFMGYREDILLFEFLYNQIHCMLAFTRDGIDTSLSQSYATTFYVDDGDERVLNRIQELSPYIIELEFTNMYSTWEIISSTNQFAFIREAVLHDKALVLRANCVESPGGLIVFNDYMSDYDSSIIFERAAENGKFRVTVDKVNHWYGEYIPFATEEQLGTIDEALDRIIEIQNTLIGGESA